MTFPSRLNYRLTRAEHLAATVVCAALLLLHAGQVRWVPALALFAAIDVIGYLPGLIAFKRARGGAVAPVYHLLYNVTHSLLTSGAVALIWAWAVGWEWALLALPLHLSGDRGLLGNFAKPADLPFEASHGSAQTPAWASA